MLAMVTMPLLVIVVTIPMMAAALKRPPEPRG